MSKGNCIYNVVVYIGDFSSRETRVIYTTSKQSNAERFLAEYLREHEEINKAYIERSYDYASKRNAKRMREDDEE